MKKTWMLLALFVSCASAVVVCAYSQSTIKEEPPGSVRGTVSGEGIGALEGIPIVIQGAEAASEMPPVLTDENGAYQASLPPGVYTVYPKFSPGDPWYRRFRRAKFRVVSGANTTIDLSPFAGLDYCSQKGERLVDLRPTDIGSSTVRKIPSPNYDVYSIPQTVGQPLDMVIDFCKREMKGGLIFYKSVVVTYNDMTLYADTVSLRPKDFLLQIVTGKATIISAGESRQVTQFSSFIGKTAFIELTDGFTESIKGKAKLQDKNISFDLDIDRAGRGKLFYEDREKGITLVAEGENISSVTTVAPNKVTLIGHGVATADKLPYSSAGGGYSNFTLTIETYNSKGRHIPSTLSIGIPRIKGYTSSGIIADRSIHIRRETMLPGAELADSMH